MNDSKLSSLVNNAFFTSDILINTVSSETNTFIINYYKYFAEL